MKRRLVKKWIPWLVLSLLFAALPLAPAAQSQSQPEGTPFVSGKEGVSALNFSAPEEMLAQMEPVCSAGGWTFYFDPASLFFGLRNDGDDRILTSNPYNAALSQNYVGNIKNNLLSQLVVSYTDASNNPGTLWSYGDCVELKQFTAYRLPNGVEIALSIGKDQQARLLPEVISKSSFEQVLGRMKDEFSKMQVQFLYKETSLEGLNQEEAQALREKYPHITEEPLYILNENLTETEKDRLEGYFVDAGYTQAELEAEYEKNQYTVPEVVFPNFKMTLRYTLDEDGFRVSLPASSISFDKENYHLQTIRVLEYFASQAHNAGDPGFLLVPDGSGAVINFSDQGLADSQSQIIGQLYGVDSAISYPDAPSRDQVFYLPVFGHANGTNAVLGIVEKGSGLCSLTFGAGGGVGNFYTAFPTFTYVASEQLSIEAKVYSAYSTRNTTVYDENAYTGDYTVLYRLLAPEQATYSGMAGVYRQYLFGDTSPAPLSTLPLSVETIGTVPYPSSFLGFGYTASAKLTTFEQDMEILKNLQEAGVNDLILSLEGWRKHGLNWTAANRLDPSSALGGKSGLKKLFQWCEEQQIPLYPHVDFAFVGQDKWFDGFSPNNDTARLMTKKLGGKMRIRPDKGIYDQDTFQYATAPCRYEPFMGKFFAQASRQQLSSFGLTSLGNVLNSDFQKGRQSNREQTLQTIGALLDKHSQQNRLAFDGANAFVLPYASFISNLPAKASGFQQESYSVPFVQLVLHGITPYASTALNSQADMQQALLSCVATLSSPHVQMVMDNIDKLKLTRYTYYNSIDYNQWFHKGVEAYQFVRDALAPVVGATLLRHETPAPGITRMTFDNGVTLYVNQTSDPYTDGSQTIPAMSCRPVH